MYLNILICLILVAVSVLLGWLTVRAWRAENAIVKWGGFDQSLRRSDRALLFWDGCRTRPGIAADDAKFLFEQ